MSDWNDRFTAEDGRKGKPPIQKKLPRVPTLRSMNGSAIKSVIRTRPDRQLKRRVTKPKGHMAPLGACQQPAQHDDMVSQALRKETSAPVLPLKSRADAETHAFDGMPTRASMSQDGLSKGKMAGIGVSAGNPDLSPEVQNSLVIDIVSASRADLPYPASPCASLGDISLGGDAEIFDDSEKPFPLCRLMKIGRGSSSTVYKSVIFPSLQVVAEKVVTITEKDKRKQLVRELKYLRTLFGAESRGCCRSIVQLMDVVSNPRDGTVSICLEYMNSGSLQDVIRVGGCKSEYVLARISYQVLSGLEFLHAHRQIHRDIKPGNILVNSAGCVKISDFGLSRELQSGHSLAESFIGTYNYMSPERIAGQKYTFSCDIWSFGLTILACSLGKYPYAIEHGYWSLLHAIQQQPVPVPSGGGYTNVFCSFISIALQKDQNKRANAHDLLSHAFLQGIVAADGKDFDDLAAPCSVSPEKLSYCEGYDMDEFEDHIRRGSNSAKGPIDIIFDQAFLDVIRPIEDWILRNPLQNPIHIVPKNKLSHRKDLFGLCPDIIDFSAVDIRSLQSISPSCLSYIGLPDQFLKDFCDNIERFFEIQNPGLLCKNESAELLVPELPIRKTQVRKLALSVGMSVENMTLVFIFAIKKYYVKQENAKSSLSEDKGQVNCGRNCADIIKSNCPRVHRKGNAKISGNAKITEKNTEICSPANRVISRRSTDPKSVLPKRIDSRECAKARGGKSKNSEPASKSKLELRNAPNSKIKNGESSTGSILTDDGSLVVPETNTVGVVATQDIIVLESLPCFNSKNSRAVELCFDKDENDLHGNFCEDYEDDFDDAVIMHPDLVDMAVDDSIDAVVDEMPPRTIVQLQTGAVEIKEHVQELTVSSRNRAARSVPEDLHNDNDILDVETRIAKDLSCNIARVDSPQFDFDAKDSKSHDEEEEVEPPHEDPQDNDYVDDFEL